MLNEKLSKKLTQQRKQTKNIMSPSSTGYADETKHIDVADEYLRSYAQNLIDHVPEHRHLKGAKILLLIQTNDANDNKRKKGQKISIGKAVKAGANVKFLAGLGMSKSIEPDFIIFLDGDHLDIIGATTDKGRKSIADGRGLEKSLSLIDHELLHCGAKITGEFVHLSELGGFVQDLGTRHIETCDDITNEADGTILVRYYQTDDNGYIYTIRKHDIEEFQGVIKRHGAKDREIGRLIDNLVINEPTLFGKAKVGSTE